MKIIIDFLMRTEEKKKYLRLVRELQEYRRRSIRLTLEGEQSTPECIANACIVMEEGCYMRDYISNDMGAIIEIRFDKVPEGTLEQ